MGFLDIVLGALLVYALYKGLRNGLFAELASLLSLVLGIYLAIKCSHFVKEYLVKAFSWSSKYVEIMAFALTFLAIVIGIHLLAKVFTKIMDFAFLGWINTLAGGLLSVLKTILLLSVVCNLFQKINLNNMLVKEETFEQSLLYNPIQKTARFIYPSLEKWYSDFKNTQTTKPTPSHTEE
ncbi:CvpA family protein [Flavobacterium crassostreae]|uniref:Colicin V production protein n=1 Tax=Flavobacterium crassostreae TaxID=1763534 RepID=A0A1B9E5P6_9FLAO|nr:CvpA family protein [Flavobacterium crassostreae]OCB77282.1 colicin V production protein [Flavobacterium crassostreae]